MNLQEWRMALWDYEQQCGLEIQRKVNLTDGAGYWSLEEGKSCLDGWYTATDLMRMGDAQIRINRKIHEWTESHPEPKP